jgi:hypothetical protein
MRLVVVVLLDPTSDRCSGFLHVAMLETLGRGSVERSDVFRRHGARSMGEVA